MFLSLTDQFRRSFRHFRDSILFRGSYRRRREDSPTEADSQTNRTLVEYQLQIRSQVLKESLLTTNDCYARCLAKRD